MQLALVGPSASAGAKTSEKLDRRFTEARLLSARPVPCWPRGLNRGWACGNSAARTRLLAEVMAHEAPDNPRLALLRALASECPTRSWRLRPLPIQVRGKT